MTTIPLSPIKRIMREVGADRVSDDAVKAIQKEIIEYAREIAVKANETSKFAGRKTVRAKDVEFALNN